MSAMNTTQASGLFSTLGANTRLAIFRLLVKQGGQGMVAGDIAKALDVSPANLSFHLKELSHAGLVGVQQEGRFQRYRADLALMLDLVAFLTEECCVDDAQNSCCTLHNLPVCGQAPLPDSDGFSDGLNDEAV